jgi:tetratricopeptide (TPR) repeat protein
MLKPYRKITKKELKEDKFVMYTIKAKEYVENNSKTLLWAGVILVLAIVAITWYARSKSQANITANQLLGQAQFAFAQGNDSLGIKQIKSLIDDYAGVPAAGQGCFLLAKYYWQLDDFANAKIYFKKYIDDYGNDDLLTSGAMAGYADCLIKDNDAAGAASYYEKAAEVNKNLPLAPSYLYSAALAYQDAGELDKASKIADQIIKNYDKSDYKQKAELLLEMIKLKT